MAHERVYTPLLNLNKLPPVSAIPQDACSNSCLMKWRPPSEKAQNQRERVVDIRFELLAKWSGRVTRYRPIENPAPAKILTYRSR